MLFSAMSPPMLKECPEWTRRTCKCPCCRQGRRWWTFRLISFRILAGIIFPHRLFLCILSQKVGREVRRSSEAGSNSDSCTTCNDQSCSPRSSSEHLLRFCSFHQHISVYRTPVSFPFFFPLSSMTTFPKVYTVNGPSSTSSASLPSWITTKTRPTKPAGSTHRKRVKTQRQVGQLELVQDFAFPESAIKIKTTEDGHFAIGTGTYKPMMKVWDLDQLTVKFERVTDAENVDFVVSLLL